MYFDSLHYHSSWYIKIYNFFFTPLTSVSFTKMGKGNIHISWSVTRNITLLNITLIPRTSTPKLKLKRWNSSYLCSCCFHSRWTFRYIDDVLSINNHQFHSHVDSIYPNELEIKDTTEYSTFASYLDVLLMLDTNGKITSQLYDKLDDFNFSIVNFPYLCSNIPASPAYGVYISQLIRYAWACSTYDQFFVRGSLLTIKLMSQGFQLSHLQAALGKLCGHYNDVICPYNLSLDRMLSDMFHTNR